jgi:hypothetical protein
MKLLFTYRDIYPEPVLESHYAHYGSDEFTDALLSLFVKYRDHYGTRLASFEELVIHVEFGFLAEFVEFK